MIKNLIILIYPFFIFLVNFFFIKKNIIPNYSGDYHQKFFKKANIQLIGGILMIPIFVLITFNHSLFLTVSLILIFLLGLSSDTGFISSAKLRLLIQSLIIFIFLIYSETVLSSVRIEKFDLLLSNHWFGLLFTLICLMILTNGTNFIDGLNGLVLTYYLTKLLIIFYLRLYEFSFLNQQDVILMIMIFSYLAIFNFFNKLYIGDSGSYVIGFLLGYILLQIYENNLILSPYFIAVLLWYPAFEILFSIIRKLRINKSPLKPDNKHLHHLLFLFFDKKLNFSKKYLNNLASIAIILYNSLIFLIATQNIYHTGLQIFLFSFNIFLYLILYFKLNQLKKS